MCVVVGGGGYEFRAWNINITRLWNYVLSESCLGFAPTVCHSAAC